ncbi:MAG: UvrB/UvrC motif-containing protein [Patescibacteria group bacterium]
MEKLWEKIYTLEAFQKKNALPEAPGAYFFLDAGKELLYIGKATSLRDRVKSYFSRDIALSRGPKIMRMLEQARFIAYRQTDSVLEALILESRLIKEHQPPYNTDAKDDKSYNHIAITQEKFPRVLIVRGRDLVNRQPTIYPVKSSIAGPPKAEFHRASNRQQKTRYKYIFGPFPHGMQLREALKIIRKLFPFRDKCLPAEVLTKEGMPSKKRTELKPCFNRQIGLCPGVCTGEISAREYGRIINHIRLFFEGRKSVLVRKLEREMKTAAKQLAFERASEIKKTLFGLRHIQDMALVKDDQQLTVNSQQKTIRIEAYDVAHLGGDASVGVMVVLSNGQADKESYRKFILRGGHNGNDLTALQEILARRLKHTPPATFRKRSAAIRAGEWPLPDIIVVDGGELQVRMAQQAILNLAVSPLSKLRGGISVVGVVKNAKHQPERLIGPETLTKRFKKEILLANSEAHRFAITFHRKRRGKEFLKM